MILRSLLKIFLYIASASLLSGCGAVDFLSPKIPSSAKQRNERNPSSLIHFQESLDVSELKLSLAESFFALWNDPFLIQQWYLRNEGQPVPSVGEGLAGADIRLPDLGVPSPSVTPVILALIDTGVDFAHPDLNPDMFFMNAGEMGVDVFGRDKSVNGIDDDGNGYADDVSGWSFADDTSSQRDALGHGTHLAGLLAARRDNAFGIASPWNGFKILSVQIFSGAHPSVSAEKIAEAIRYSVDMGARVISASFGTPNFSQALYDAVNYARQHDVLFVSAVGNFRKNLDREPSYPASYQLENQISVAASDNQDLASVFTNYGKNVDLFAPGTQIFSTVPRGQFGFRSGTSQACPLVAAVGAELRARMPNKSSVEVKQQIIEAADELSGLSGFSRTARRLNLSNTLAGRSGERLMSSEGKTSRLLSYTAESEHPYRAGVVQKVSLQLPSGVTAFRVHFEKFSTHSADTLTIRDSTGRRVQRLSGELGEFWSTLIHGSTAELEFTTDAFVSDWGWKVDMIELIAP